MRVTIGTLILSRSVFDSIVTIFTVSRSQVIQGCNVQPSEFRDHFKFCGTYTRMMEAVPLSLLRKFLESKLNQAMVGLRRASFAPTSIAMITTAWTMSPTDLFNHAMMTCDMDILDVSVELASYGVMKFSNPTAPAHRCPIGDEASMRSWGRE